MFTALRRTAARLRALLGARELDRDFDEELASHLTMATEENIRRGMTPGEARRAAAVRFGGTQSIREQHRDARGLPGIESVLQDLRFASRLVVKDRWFSGAVILALALGIGANATGFSLVNAVFLRALPFAEAERLYTVSWQTQSNRRSNMSYAELEDWRAQSRSFAGLAAYLDGSMNISDGHALPERVRGTWITANTFGVLRQQPFIGRGFTAADERAGADAVVIIGHTIWKNRYGGDASVLGRSLRVNGQPFSIVGVMPERMKFPDDSEIWTPFIPTGAQRQRDVRALRMFGRLRDGADRLEAQAEASAVGRQLMAAHPGFSKDLVLVRVETFTERYIGGAGRPMFYTIMGAVVFVLLIACANVANLLLSRSGVRAREMALRMALGATRWRVLRQLLIESLLLAVIGGSIGLAFAVIAVRAFAAAAVQSELPYWVSFTVDGMVVAYVAAICVVTTVLFGLAPALHVAKTNHHDVLKNGGRGSIGSRRLRWFDSAIVVSELALTLMLLAGAGLMVRSFITLYTTDLGIDVDHLTTMRVELPEERYRTPEARLAFFDRLEPRLVAIPGVDAAAVTTGVPPLDGGERLLEIDGPARTADARPVFVGTVTISPTFFDVVGASLVRGRLFERRDGAAGVDTVIINERLAAQFFPDQDPLGRRLRFVQRDGRAASPAPVWRTIVGICPSIKHGSPEDGYVNAVVYIPYRQETPAAASLLVRSTLPPGSVMDAVRREVQAIDRDQPVFSIQTVAQVLAADRWWWRTWGTMFAICAAIALVLSSVGLYAVVAYSVTQRTQEIGVRMAVGAQRWQVSWMILKLGLMQVAIAAPIGLAGTWALSRVMRRGLLTITQHTPATLIAITMLLASVSIVACLVPARRATRVDPVVALRAE